MDQALIQDTQARLHEALQRAGLAYEDIKVFVRLTDGALTCSSTMNASGA